MDGRHISIPGRNPDTRMDTVAPDSRTAPAVRHRAIHHIHRIAYSRNTPAGRSDPWLCAQNRGDIEFRKQRLVVPECVRAGIGLRLQAAAFHEI